MNITPVQQPLQPEGLLNSLQPLCPPLSLPSTPELIKVEATDTPRQTGPPPVESLLAHISNQLESGSLPTELDGKAILMTAHTNLTHPASLAAADLATKEWLSGAKVGIPRMVRDGDTGQIALSHADVGTRWWVRGAVS